MSGYKATFALVNGGVATCEATADEMDHILELVRLGRGTIVLPRHILNARHVVAIELDPLPPPKVAG